MVYAIIIIVTFHINPHSYVNFTRVMLIWVGCEYDSMGRQFKFNLSEIFNNLYIRQSTKWLIYI